MSAGPHQWRLPFLGLKDAETQGLQDQVHHARNLHQPMPVQDFTVLGGHAGVVELAVELAERGHGEEKFGGFHIHLQRLRQHGLDTPHRALSCHERTNISWREPHAYCHFISPDIFFTDLACNSGLVVIFLFIALQSATVAEIRRHHARRGKEDAPHGRRKRRHPREILRPVTVSRLAEGTVFGPRNIARAVERQVSKTRQAWPVGHRCNARHRDGVFFSQDKSLRLLRGPPVGAFKERREAHPWHDIHSRLGRLVRRELSFEL